MKWYLCWACVPATILAGAAFAALPIERSMPAYVDDFTLDIFDAFVVWFDMSDVAHNYPVACPDAAGLAKQFVIYQHEIDGQPQSVLYAHPEVVKVSCPVSGLPEGVEHLRLESLCGDKPTVLTTFDGKTADVIYNLNQELVLVGPPFAMPECDRVAHQVTVRSKPLEADSIEIDHPFTP